MSGLARPRLEGVAVEHVWLDVDGVRIHVAQAGSGPPLALLHGWPQNWWAWRKLIPSLARDHRVICPDLRGFGWSDAPPGSYEKERFAADLLGVLDALEVERAGLVGVDWGGFAGFLACLRAPERFSGFVALAITHPWMNVPAVPDPRQLARIWYQVVIATPLLGRTLLQRRARDLIARAGGGVWDDATIEVYSEALRRPATAAATVALYRTFLTRELPRIARGRYAGDRLTVPTLLLVGDRDPVIPAGAIEGFEAHGDALELEWLAGAHHWLPEERPDVVEDRIRRLLG